MLLTGLMTVARYSVRQHACVERGDIITDFLLSMCLFFLVLPQMEAEIAFAEDSGTWKKAPKEAEDDAGIIEEAVYFSGSAL